MLVLNSSKLFLASDLGFTGIPESGFRGPGLRGLDLGFWVSGGLGPCFAPEAPVVRPRASRRRRTTPKGDSPGGGFSPGGGHSTIDVQSKAVDLNQEEKFSPPGGRSVASEGEKPLLRARAPFLTVPERIPDRMLLIAIV